MCSVTSKELKYMMWETHKGLAKRLCCLEATTEIPLISCHIIFLLATSHNLNDEGDMKEVERFHLQEYAHRPPRKKAKIQFCH